MLITFSMKIHYDEVCIVLSDIQRTLLKKVKNILLLLLLKNNKFIKILLLEYSLHVILVKKRII